MLAVRRCRKDNSIMFGASSTIKLSGKTDVASNMIAKVRKQSTVKMVFLYQKREKLAVNWWFSRRNVRKYVDIR
jgi:hypothetical protein